MFVEITDIALNWFLTSLQSINLASFTNAIETECEAFACDWREYHKILDAVWDLMQRYMMLQ